MKYEELAKGLYEKLIGYLPPELKVGLMKERDFIPLASALLDGDIVLNLEKKNVVVGQVRICSILHKWRLLDGDEIIFDPDDMNSEMKRHEGKRVRIVVEELPDEEE